MNSVPQIPEQQLVMPNQDDLLRLSSEAQNAIPPNVVNQNNLNLDEDDFDIHEPAPTSPFQKAEISKLRVLLRRAYNDAPKANFNQDIQRLITAPWHTARFASDGKSLAYVLHVEKGWTAAKMKQILGKAPIPFTVKPLNADESRFLGVSLRYGMQEDAQLFKPDIPGNWLTDDMKYKEVTKACVVQYAKKVA